MSKIYDRMTSSPYFDQREEDRMQGMEHDYDYEQSAGVHPEPSSGDDIPLEAFGTESWIPETKGGRK